MLGKKFSKFLLIVGESILRNTLGAEWIDATFATSYIALLWRWSTFTASHMQLHCHTHNSKGSIAFSAGPRASCLGPGMAIIYAVDGVISFHSRLLVVHSRVSCFCSPKYELNRKTNIQWSNLRRAIPRRSICWKIYTPDNAAIPIRPLSIMRTQISLSWDQSPIRMGNSWESKLSGHALALQYPSSGNLIGNWITVPLCIEG